MRKVDLHIHSTASDGTWTPQDLVDAAVGAGLGIIAVTDHDSTANVAETVRLAGERGIKCVPGVEVCSTTGRGGLLYEGRYFLPYFRLRHRPCQ